MKAGANRQLGALSLATLLVSAQYGLGFLLGAAEQAMTWGPGGSLYPVSIVLGLLAEFSLIRFYWTEVDQIWTLLGNRYGRPVQLGTGLMAWLALIGAEAVQMIAAATILHLAGVPTVPSLIGLTGLFFGLSLLPMEKASWVFRGLLLCNIGVLAAALGVLHGLPDYWRSPVGFVATLPQLGWEETVGVSCSTVLLVMIDMKCQQFVVQARDVRTAYYGCALAALILLALAFLPPAVVTAAVHAGILPPDLGGKAVIPYILAWMGGGATQLWGMVLMAALALPALGLGSNVLRIQAKTILDLELLAPCRRNRILIALLNALLALAIALHGGEVIRLMLCFYSAYLAAVWLPFLAYLLEHRGVYRFSPTGVQVCLILSSLAALATLGVTLFQPQLILKSAELTILAAGLGVGGVSLLSAHLLEQTRLVWQRRIS